MTSKTNGLIVADAMINAYRMLPRALRDVTVWEMDIETLRMIAVTMNPDFDVEEIELHEVRCFGMRVRVTDRPGVRLVFAVIEL
jgi:hypothetical protein